MIATDVDLMPAGPAINHLVAEKVMGWKSLMDGRWYKPNTLSEEMGNIYNPQGPRTFQLPDFSNSLDAAMIPVAYLKEMNPGAVFMLRDDGNGLYQAHIDWWAKDGADDEHIVYGDGHNEPNPALVICHAVLKVVGAASEEFEVSK